MGLSTQVADRSRQSASPYPWSVTRGFALLHLSSAVIVLGLMADFVYELRGDQFAVPWPFILTLAAASVAVCEQLSDFVRQKYAYSAGLNILIHAPVTTLWLMTLIVMSYWLQPMVLSHSCSIDLWKTDMGVMVCQMYKALYAFIVISLVTSIAIIIIDIMVLTNHKTLAQYSRVNTEKKVPVDEKNGNITALRQPEDHEPTISPRQALLS